MARNQLKKYTPEFKREALRLLETSGKSIPQLERELDITHGLLYKWKQRYQLDQVTGEVKPSDQQALEAENRHLRRELELVKAERELLKKWSSCSLWKRDEIPSHPQPTGSIEREESEPNIRVSAKRVLCVVQANQPGAKRR